MFQHRLRVNGNRMSTLMMVTCPTTCNKTWHIYKNRNPVLSFCWPATDICYISDTLSNLVTIYHSLPVRVLPGHFFKTKRYRRLIKLVTATLIVNISTCWSPWSSLISLARVRENFGRHRLVWMKYGRKRVCCQRDYLMDVFVTLG